MMLDFLARMKSARKSTCHDKLKRYRTLVLLPTALSVTAPYDGLKLLVHVCLESSKERKCPVLQFLLVGYHELKIGHFP